MEGPMFENTIELHTRANHKGNINQVPEPPLSCCQKHIKYGKGEDTYLKPSSQTLSYHKKHIK